MLSPKGLIVLYNDLQARPQPHLKLPVRFFLGSLMEFFLLLFLAAACAYNVLYLISVFLWLYVPFLAFLFGKIWDLYGLSVPKLYITIGIFYLITILMGSSLQKGFLFLFDLLFH